MELELEGRVALVTGGGSGMGRATAQRLVNEGMKVCIVDINEDAATAVAESIGAYSVACDVSDPAQVEAAFARCVQRYGSVDLAHLNAGVGFPSGLGDIGNLDLDLYHRSVGVNLNGVVYGAKAALRTMREHSAGQECAIVATSSIAGFMPYHPDPVYTIGKHGVVALIRAMAPNLAAEGIACHVLCPGITDTGMVPKKFQRMLAKMGIPVQSPENVAEAVVFAATSPIDTAGTCWIVQADTPPFAFEFAEFTGPDSLLNVHS